MNEGRGSRGSRLFRRDGFLRSAAVLSLGGLIAKGVGALYRIPLSSLLGGYGTGLYQMAYPLFCVALTFSSVGVPSAFSRLLAGEIAAGREGRSLTGTALRLFAVLGLMGTLAMAALAGLMSAWQGESALLPCYLALAPAVLPVALIAVLRGYFQGKGDMAPTARSEIAEQAVKACAGLLFATLKRDDPAGAAVAALGAVTLSEFAALLLLWRRYRGEPKVPVLRRKHTPSSIFFSALPVMAAASLLPLSHTADSIVVVRLLSRYTDRAVSLYGLFSGGAAALAGLPSAVCSGLVAATVPAVAAHMARGDGAGGRERALTSLALTLLFAVPCAAGLFLFARPAVKLLYPALSEADAETLVSLVRLHSVSAATLAGVNTLSACLTGMGRAGRAASSMAVAVLVKLALEFLLVSDPALSVGGAAIAANACYLVAFFLDLFYTVRKSKREKERDHHRKSWNGAGRAVPSGEGDPSLGGRSVRADGGIG